MRIELFKRMFQKDTYELHEVVYNPDGSIADGKIIGEYNSMRETMLKIEELGGNHDSFYIFKNKDYNNPM